MRCGFIYTQKYYTQSLLTVVRCLLSLYKKAAVIITAALHKLCIMHYEL